MSVPTVCFSHGKESGPWGTKISALAEIARSCSWAIESLDYRGMGAEERVALLLEWCERQTGPYALVGSSMGGYVAAAAAQESMPIGLFLMAPAFFVPGYEQWTPALPACPVTIVHGWRDEIIPWRNSARFAADSHATLHLLDSDHGLVDVLNDLEHQFQLFLNSLG